MSVRQYIGSRYVTKIYENTLDPSSAEWEQNSYEPLTLVTYLNSSYLSKKAVPNTIGNPADNPSYWVIMGNYNAQIAHLQNEIDNINRGGLFPLIKNISDRKFVFVGDSYGVVPTPETSSIGTAISLLGINADQYHNLSISGATMTDFISEVTGYSYSDNDDITDVIVTGGINDCRTDGYQLSDLPTKIPQLITAIKSTFPNAIIWAGFSGNGYYTNQIGIHPGFNYENVQNIKYLWEKYFSSDSKVIYMDHLDEWCRDLYDTDFFDEPGGALHPMRLGVEVLGTKIAHYLKSGTSIDIDLTDGEYNLIQGAQPYTTWLTDDQKLYYGRHANQVYIRIKSGGFAFSPYVTLNNQNLKIITQSIDPDYPDHSVVNMKDGFVSSPVFYMIDGESTFRISMATFTLSGGEIFVKIPYESSGINNVKVLWYPDLNFILPANAI